MGIENSPFEKRTERVAWTKALEAEPPEQVVTLNLTEHEAGDLQRALAIYKANSLAVSRQRPLTHDELQSHGTVGKVQRQIKEWKFPTRKKPK